ncbi:WD40/YVTN/BNR-like repeat-containing protein [Cupriavidus sp. TMH.W2]|uniref:WD40/YVTN/BNR-like repeat-containing protein n=1 Tax=Cupriavidus sp. TMH.W2 TaxID=3434465 RepID=UPI003D76CFDC
MKLSFLLTSMAMAACCHGMAWATANDGGAAPAQGAVKLDRGPAVRSPSAVRASMLGAARAGERIVAVGDHGVVLLSDDGGKTFRQALHVPTRAVLTAVSFADARNGWAVGHHGVILYTADGGERWTLQRSDTSADQPLFTVLFLDGQHGVAAGLWSLLLETDDGGRTWNKRELPAPPGGKAADRNLFRIFAATGGKLFIAAEQGLVLRSLDQGKTWTYQQTGYKGSFWTGAAERDGSVVVGGMRGTVYRSRDGGDSWSQVQSGTASSLTDLVPVEGGVAGVGLEGALIRSGPDGASFEAATRPDRLDLTAAVAAPDGMLVLFSSQGPVAASTERR